MIQKIRENGGTILICGVILFGVPAAMSSASTNSPEGMPTSTATVSIDPPVMSANLGGSTGGNGSVAGTGGSLGGK